jgi:MoaA/NifB/PqqE/SkfB family radical SAM enzyme
MKLEDIGFYTLSDARAENASHESRMMRGEVLLTDDCNFNCPYCRGIRSDCAGSMAIDKAKAVIDFWAEDRLKNIRFSGGEPTMYPGIHIVIRHARRRGVERIALSTNGTAPTDLYMQLIDDGVNDFSVSLDACCAGDAQKMAGTKAAHWERIRDNIREISARTYLTVGVVLTEHNEADAKKIVDLALELGAHDVRVIPAAQYKRGLQGAKHLFSTGDHKILDYRLANIEKGRDLRGLGELDFRRCPLVLDDSAVAGDFHFPCIIYLREGGDPIGRVSGNMRQERLEWFQRTNTYENPICRGNCLDVCVDYNNKWLDTHLGGLERLNTEYFDFSTWRSGSYLWTELHLRSRFHLITSDYGKREIRKHAVGWAPGRLLAFRPKAGHIGVMFFIDGEHGWCHMRKNEFYEVFGGRYTLSRV